MMGVKNNEFGFSYIECIISLSILIISSYLIASSLTSSFNFINRSSTYSEMLTIAKDKLYEVKNNISNFNEVTIYNDYNIYTTLENYSKFYKINVEVEKNNMNVELIGYVSK
jgi:type II secretory pathway pseudopilin PulG